MTDSSPRFDDPEAAVRDRYGRAAERAEPALCCAVSYDPALLAAIPDEVIERDYGCGNPAQHVRAGERVLDLGSGTGKACFLSSQVVGAAGSVIGVDMSDEMLAVARRAAPVVAERIGYGNVSFRKGRIQDLRLDRELVDAWLREHPVSSDDDLLRFESVCRELRDHSPLVPDESVDVVVSSCVLNLVRPEDKATLFAELYRVLRRGGRAIISDIVSCTDVPEPMRRDPDLWSGCISGALREDRFLEAFEAAGFYGVSLIERQAEPWQMVDGIAFRSVTVAAWRGKDGPCLDRGQAVIYRGPFREVTDDDGHTYRRGERTPVCEKTFGLLGRAPYSEHFAPVTAPGEAPTAPRTDLCGPGSDGRCC